MPAYNEEKELPKTLEKITSAIENFNSKGRGECEVLVVDNASSDKTAEIAKSFGARVLREEKRQIARARNRGAKFAEGEILLFCDADSHLHPQTLVRIAELLKDPDVIGGGIRILPDEENSLNRTWLFFWDAISRTLQISGGTLFLRRDVFEAVGGFSEKFYIGEEISLQIKMKLYALRNHPLFLSPGACPDFVGMRGRRSGGRIVLLNDCPVKTSMRKIREYGFVRYSWAVLRCIFFPFLAMQKKYCSLWYDVRAEG